MKMKYDESDNALIRASRVLTDKVTDLLGEWAAPGPSPPLIEPAVGRGSRTSPCSWLGCPRGPVLED